VVARALAFGLVLLALFYISGAISGCHVNPAMTLGVVVSARIELRDAVTTGWWSRP
jgi:aquaporin Z